MQREIENYIREKSYWPEIEEEVHRQVNAVKDQNPSLYAMDPLRVIREAEQRALAITGVKNKLNLGEARRKADEARRLASLQRQIENRIFAALRAGGHAGDHGGSI